MPEGISIIIPTLNGGSVFSQCLAMIGMQKYSGQTQLIVIDSGSTDGTDVLAENAGALVKRIDKKRFHHARTRNQAVRYAVFDRVLFMVQDAIPCSEQWLSEMAHSLEKPGFAAAFAKQIPHLDATPYARFETESIANARLSAPEIGNIHSIKSFQALPYDDAYRRIGLDNVCAIYRKEVLEKAPFPDVEFAEDLAWALKVSLLGYRIMYLPHIRIRHSHNRLPDYAFRRQIVNSYWVARIMGRLREDLSSLSLQDLAFFTFSVRMLVLQRMTEVRKGMKRFQLKDLFLDHLWKRYPLITKLSVRWSHPYFSKYSGFPDSKVQAIAERLNADITNQLNAIEEGYPPRGGEEWLQTLEMVAANVLGRMHGEVYAGITLTGSVPPQLENVISPFLSGV